LFCACARPKACSGNCRCASCRVSCPPTYIQCSFRSASHARPSYIHLSISRHCPFHRSSRIRYWNPGLVVDYSLALRLRASNYDLCGEPAPAYSSSASYNYKKKNRKIWRIMTISKAEMDFDGFREDKVPPPGRRTQVVRRGTCGAAGDKARRKKHLGISN